MRLILHSLFISGYWISFLGTYEKFWETYRLGIDHSVWFSSTTVFGLSIPHHAYIGFIMLGLGYVTLTIKDYNTFNSMVSQSACKENILSRIKKYILS